jgi:dTDP-4-amino-4,6-dideoxygalactose transaminase
MSELALNGGEKTRKTPWPQWPERSEREEALVLQAVREGDWGGFPLPNTFTRRFTEAFAQRHDSDYGLCVANGTIALEVGLQALSVAPGSEVIVPAYTFEATASAALFSGCIPVFVDVDPRTYCLDPSKIEAAITRRTAAIVPVHLAMSFADMPAITDIARKHGLRVLEDCAHAHGGRFEGRAAGSMGDAGAFSFQTSKLLTAGEGGMVLTGDPEVWQRLYSLVNCGRYPEDAAAGDSLPAVIGHNYRMSDLQAALLLAQLERMDEQHERRRRNSEVLWRQLDALPGISTLWRDPRVTERAIYQYVFRFDEHLYGTGARDLFVAALQAEGIPCDGRFYESLPESPLLAPDLERYPFWDGSEPRFDCPVARRAAYSEAVWLSHHLLLGSEADVEQIITAIEKVLRHLPELVEAAGAGTAAGLPAAERARTPRARRS